MLNFRLERFRVYSFPLTLPPPERVAESILVVGLREEVGEAETAFLGKVLGAVRKDMQKDAKLLLLAPRECFKFSEWVRQGAIRQVLFFGVGPESAQLNLEAPFFRVLELCGAKLLFAPSPKRLQADKALKSALWKALQEMFELKK
ncbi:MAG: hypothetical protein D6765_01200 [Bacteroidetes bacterium]|nr:MAG: hypothetical protein D6765_01200 [Bacteroidota bacterium]